jgi:hypothetical protein
MEENANDTQIFKVTIILLFYANSFTKKLRWGNRTLAKIKRRKNYAISTRNFKQSI